MHNPMTYNHDEVDVVAKLCNTKKGCGETCKQQLVLPPSHDMHKETKVASAIAQTQCRSDPQGVSGLHI